MENYYLTTKLKYIIYDLKGVCRGYLAWMEKDYSQKLRLINKNPIARYGIHLCELLICC